MAKQKNLELIPFRIEHISLIEAREHEAMGLLKMENVYEQLAAMADASVECGTYIADGKIICCAGYYELWKGVAEVWTIPSIYVPEYALSFARALRGYVDRIINELGYHRVQTACPDDALHHRWMRWLKMEPEGVLRQYTNNRDNYCM